MTREPGQVNLVQLWNWAVMRPVWVILALAALQYGLTLGAKDLWFSDEVRHGGVLMDLMRNGDWLALRLNGELYPDKPPLYFWYVAGFWAVFGMVPWAFYLAHSLTVTAFYFAAWHLARVVSGRRDIALIAVFVLSSGYYFALMSHYARMDAAFSAAICLAWAAFYQGLAEETDRRRILQGFGFTALAVMIKGPVGFLFPVLSLVGFAIWQGRGRVLGDRAVLAGLGLVVAVVALWAGGLIAIAGREYFDHLFRSQILHRGLEKGPDGLGYLRYLVTLPLCFLPWSLIVLSRPATGPGQTRGNQGFLWLTVGLGLLSLSVISEKHEYYLMPLLAPLAILAAWRIVALPLQSRIWQVIGGFSAALGALFVVAALTEAIAGPVGGAIGRAMLWLWLPGLVLILTTALGFRVRSGGSGPATLGVTLSVTGFAIVAALTLFPPLNDTLSPRRVASVMKEYVADGHATGVMQGNDGVFAYHLGMNYSAFVHARDVLAWIEAEPRAVLLTNERYWNAMKSQAPTLEPVRCVELAGAPLVILKHPATGAPDPTPCNRQRRR